QIWWGHRIPAWYCQSCGETIVSRTDPECCPKCKAGADQLQQDPDVLDTWFSSWLWPFSTLGWPEKTEDLAKFYPTSALVTAYDIIFFWVSRMIMAGLEFTGKAPFHDIYIHGLVRDKQGRKMSKSLGNGIDPLDIIEQYGSDALKFTLSFLCAQGQDILIDNESFKMGSRFCNKVWNASRYILGNLEGRTLIPVKDEELTELDRWIYAAMDKAVREERAALESYRYNDAAGTIYEFFWNYFCDWYVEATKLSFRGDDEHEKDRAVSVLLNVLEESLRMLHPFIPFVTEEIYGKLPLAEIIENRKKAGSQKILPNEDYSGKLVTAPFPQAADGRVNEKVTGRFAVLQDLIRAVRGLRNECGIDPATKLHIALQIVAGSDAEVCREKVDMICLLAGVAKIDFVDAKPAQSIGAVGSGFEAFILIDEGINKDQLLTRFKKDSEKAQAEAKKTEAKLGGSFAQHAPQELVQAERDKLDELKRRIEKLTSYIAELQ
ncbi:MAG: class I tRNA ligase family protein, partial [Treponema sp.]|nr:class I tRNA ligase family protein [Treponema sp.]